MAGIGGAISSIFGGIGDLAASDSYSTAADMAKKNADVVQRSTNIQVEQANRQAYQVLGTTEAVAGANGMTLSGSSMDVLKSNAQQTSLNKALIENQGAIDKTGWMEKASADEGQASASTAAGIGGIAGGVLGMFGTVICTELLRQGRIPKRWYLAGARVSSKYPAAVLEGYRIWAVPSVRHLRAHPNSLYSRFLEAIFIWYLGNISAAAGVTGARKLWRGVVVTFVIWRLCYAVGWVRLSLNRLTDWEALYRA